MPKTIQKQEILPEISTGWIHNLTKDEIIKELTRRNLKTEGQILELKSRLFKYLKGESQPDFFQNSEQINISTDIVITTEGENSKHKMADKKPFFKPGKFSGTFSENIDTFLKRFERAAIINEWNDLEKTQYIAVYLEGAALTFYENLQYTTQKIDWPTLENKLRQEFEPTAQKDMIRLMLEKRKQLPDENTISYINEAESLCRRIDKDMSQGEMVRNIMKGLTPSIARYIGIMSNDNLDELKQNVRRYEMIEVMLNKETSHSPFDIETSIVKSRIQQINSNHINNNTENKLREELDFLKKQVEQMNNNRSNNYNQNNTPQNRNMNNNTENKLRDEINSLKMQVEQMNIRTQLTGTGQ
jgi:hypothetical protein